MSSMSLLSIAVAALTLMTTTALPTLSARRQLWSPKDTDKQIYETTDTSKVSPIAIVHVA